jgi:hypothetical protein
MITDRIASCVLLFTGCALSGCDVFGVVCTDELRPNLVVEVREAVSGEPAARGATGVAEHPGSGEITDLFALADSLRLHGDWLRERAGRYTVAVQKPGFRTEYASATVDEDRCHVRTRRVPVTLTRNSSAVAVGPLAFHRDARVAGFPASAGIRVFADTLVVSGRAAALCGDLGVVAFRSDGSWHIQFQPLQWVDSCPDVQNLQQFEARFTLVPGSNQLLITNGYGPPVELFSGVVSPQ